MSAIEIVSMIIAFLIIHCFCYLLEKKSLDCQYEKHKQDIEDLFAKYLKGC